MSSSSLRQALRQLDSSAISIQRAAAAMMVHYDKTPAVAVTEWRNCLLSRETRRDQLLPLLYVANEILQNSKRNRGNNFLKAFAPEGGGGGGGGTSALGPALRHICAADRSLTEKVRRTVKIWADRRVFSRRFVNELLTGLEPYRHAVEPPAPSAQAASAVALLPAAPTVFRDEDDATFSPQPELSQESNDTTDQDNKNSKTNNDAAQEEEDDDDDDDDDDDNDDDIMEILDNNDGDDDDDDDDDDEDPLAGSSQGAKLEVSIDLDSTVAATAASATLGATASSSKKRRSSTESHSTTASKGSNKKKSRRSSSASGTGGGSSNEISTNDLMDLWNRVSSLQQRYDLATLGMDRIQAAIRKKPDDELENLVGDQLQEAWQETLKQEEQYLDYRQQFREIAVERKQLQQKATSYLSWLKQSLQQDTEDLAFCDTLHDKISTFKQVHARIVWAHNLRQKEEEQRQAKVQEQERLRREREENERFRRAALQKQTEGGAGLVWNPTTREYQPRNTEESWRD